MTTIEDELRAVLSASSAAGASSDDRHSRLARRIQHHQRVRTTAAAAAVALLLLLTSGIALADTLSTHRPAPVATHKPDNDRLTSAAPGHLPDYADGGKLVAYDTGPLTDQATLNVTFTPTTWNFQIGTACAADSTLLLVVTVNGHLVSSVSCDRDGGPDIGSPSDSADWARFGVRLGQPMTVSTFLTRSRNVRGMPRPATDIGTGTMSVGVYIPVPWQAYPFPSRPANLPPLGGDEMNLPRVLDDVTVKGLASHATFITLPARIQTAINSVAPGVYQIYFNEALVDECDTYDWGSGCSAAAEDVGKGDLAGFRVGDRIQVRVVPAHLAADDLWRFQLAGS